MLQRVLLVTGVAAAGLAAYLWGEPEPLLLSAPVAGQVSIAGRTLLCAASVAAVFGGSLVGWGAWRSALAAALLPAMLTAGFFLASTVLPVSVPPWAVLPALALTLPGALLAEASIAWRERPPLLTLAVRRLLVYATAAATFSGVFGLGLSAPVGAPTLGLLGVALAALAWRGDETGQPWTLSRLLCAFIAGLVVAQSGWALLYWPAAALSSGLALLAIFYATTGVLAAAGQSRHWTRSAEYMLVGGAALAAIAWSVLGGL